jgi:hypothetical protein
MTLAPVPNSIGFLGKDAFPHGMVTWSWPTAVTAIVLLEPVGQLPEAGKYIHQTRPYLILPFPEADNYQLHRTSYDFYLKLDQPDGSVALSGSPAQLADNEEGIPTFIYAWEAGDTVVSGMHRGQFSAVRKSDGKIVFSDRFLLPVRPEL